MGDDELSLMQKFIGNANAFVQQSTRILPQIEDETFQVSELIEGFLNFFFRRLIEAGNVHVADAGANQEMQIDAVARNLVAHDCELDRLLRAFTKNRNMDGRSLGPLQQVGDITGIHVVGRLAIDGDNYVARVYAGAIGRGAGEGRDHNDFVVARADGHAYAVIFSALVFA